MVSTDNIRRLTNAKNTAFTVPGINRMKTIYCKCGCIVAVDSAQMKLKLLLGKELECPKCRNQRISKDIDEMNDRFMDIKKDADLCDMSP
ncbi:MAG: hypothetical protein MJZ03_01860 [archaeon]|nr:hypothetical protein [archaeon]